MFWTNTMLLLSTFKFYGNSILLSHAMTSLQSGSTDIPVSDSAWHTDCSRISSAMSDGTGLISRVSHLLYWALLRLLHSIWVICSSRSSLQHLEIDRLELTISYFTWKWLKRLLRSENFALMSFLKFSRLKTSSIIHLLTSFPTDFLFIPLLITTNWKIRYELGQNGNGCKTSLSFSSYTEKKQHFHHSYTILLSPPNNSTQWILVILTTWWNSTTYYEDQHITQQQHNIQTCSLSCWLFQNLSLLF